MIELIRGLLDRPLDPRHARAVLVLTSVLTIGFAVLVALGSIGGSAESGLAPRKLQGAHPSAPPAAPVEIPQRGTAEKEPAGQDPQDRRGTSAYRRARQALDSAPALQHVPYRSHGFSVILVGADRGRPILRIVAPTLSVARHRFRGFLRRYSDDGGGYVRHYEARSRALPAPIRRAGPSRGGRGRPAARAASEDPSRRAGAPRLRAEGGRDGR